jgi:hypothetical protein
MEQKSGIPSDSEKTRIPVTVRLGVTGHRILPQAQLLRESARNALSRLDNQLKHTPHTYIAVSPLAEGADRIVATEVLEWPVSGDSGSQGLEAILPLPKDDYIRDFKTQNSVDEFRALLDHAASVQALDAAESRPAAYDQAGRCVVDHCDILLAVWDGEPAAGQGGTAEVVRYAGEIGRSIIWINSENGMVVEKRDQDCAFESLEYLDSYNREKINPSKVRSAIEGQLNIIEEHAKTSGLTLDLLHPVIDRVLPQFVRADILAQHNQNFYKRAGVAVYAFAAAAVATVTIQTLFFPQWPQFLWLEVAEIGVILILLWATRINDWHRQWIDYRFLAERLRAMMFLGVAGVEFEPPRVPVHLRLAHHPDNWIIRAMDWIWKNRYPIEGSIKLQFESLKKFLLSAWVYDQRNFYDRTGKRYETRHRSLAMIGEALFFITLVVAGAHAAGMGDLLLPDRLINGNIFPSIAIIFPAIGAALGGIRMYREYLRNAERYRHMARYLSLLGDQLGMAKDVETLVGLLKQANEVMMIENQDWRVLILTHELRPA